MRDGTVASPVDPKPAPALGDAWLTDPDAGSDAAFFAGWLARQCAAIVATRAGLVLRATTEGLRPAAAWPSERAIPVELSRVAERAANAIRPVIAWARRPSVAGGPAAGLNVMIGVANRQQGALTGVVAVLVEVPGGIDSVDPDALAEQLLLGCGWLDARLSRRQAQKATAQTERASVAMDIVAVASMERRPPRAATAVVNELAIRLRCDRVSLGLVRRKGIKLKALSHAATFQERSRIVDAIENAMEECLVQAASVAFPPVPMTRSRIAVAHRDLAALDAAPRTTASVILPAPDGPAGVLTFERPADQPFDDETLLLAEATGTLLGPVLRVQASNDRLFAGRLVDTTRAATRTLLGPDKPSLKLAAIAAVVTIAALSLARVEYRVTARSVLEGEVQRAAVAPYDGYIAASAVRPGDRLHAGDVLAEMDDHDLVLDRARAWADVEKARQKYDEAVAKHDRPTAAQLAAEIEQGEAQLALADDKLRRAKITSPIDGLLVTGDLSQLLGTPIERGKTLFEIAPLDQYRIVLQVDERDLRFVAPGQHGQLALSGMPADHRPFTINRVTPIAAAKDGANEFRVEATLDQPPGAELRPGMEGIAKVETGPQPLLWAWTHGMIDWLRLAAWKWMP
jgi:multidrug efflux pump subunit AcrA (membrane-fusion protein)